MGSVEDDPDCPITGEDNDTPKIVDQKAALTFIILFAMFLEKNSVDRLQSLHTNAEQSP